MTENLKYRYEIVRMGDFPFLYEKWKEDPKLAQFCNYQSEAEADPKIFEMSYPMTMVLDMLLNSDYWAHSEKLEAFTIFVNHFDEVWLFEQLSRALSQVIIRHMEHIEGNLRIIQHIVNHKSLQEISEKKCFSVFFDV